MLQICVSRTVIWLALVTLLVFAQVTLPSRLVGLARPPPSAFSAWASDAPMIDGLLSPGWVLLGEPYPAEWEDADRGDFVLSWDGIDHNCTLYVMNDDVNLYIAFEIRNEDHDLDDYLWLNFDNDHDHTKAVGDDVLYLDGHSSDIDTFAGRFSDQYWPTPGEGFPVGDQFPDGTHDGVGACKFTGPKFNGTYVFELAHPLNSSDGYYDFSLQAGDTVGFNVLYMDAGGGLGSEAGWPSLTKVDWSQMSDIMIALNPSIAPGLPVLNLGIDQVEITQAIQWLNDVGQVDNSVPLVRGKSSVVRVYVDVGPAGAPVPNIEVYLYATTNGKTRAMSGVFGTNGPLHKIFTAPTTPRRGVVRDTANFLLPDYWVEDNHVTLEAFVKAPAGRSETSYSDNWMSSKTFSLTPTKPLKIGYYLIDYRPTAPDDNPNLPADVSIHHERLYEKIYPTPDLSDPTEYIPLGTLRWSKSLRFPNGTRNTMVEVDLLRTLRFIYVLYFLFLDPELDQLVAWIPANSGLPIGGRAGAAARLGDGRKVVTFIKDNQWDSLPHEIGHNLRGPHAWDDPENPWVNTTTENKTQTYGFDTRPPFRVYSPTSGEMMAYDRPRWISNWTWELLLEILYHHLAGFSSSPSDGARTQVQSSSSSLWISGTICRNNTGRLDPIFQVPYSLNTTPSSGPYTVELRGGPPAETLLYSQSFNVSFEDFCYGPMNMVSFMLDLPFITGTYSVSLWNTSISPPVLLDKITASANPPQVTITYPNGGETLGDSFNVTWTVTDADGDSLNSFLLYSNDNGATWRPLVPHVQGTNYQVDTSLLPGGAQSLIRVAASDGFHTSEDQSDTVFNVPFKEPQSLVVNTLDPSEQPTYFGEPLLLRGSAFDPEDGVLQDSALTWTSNLDGTLGVGRVLAVTDLRPGIHNITLTATDSHGNNSTDSFMVTIELHNVEVAGVKPDPVDIYKGQTISFNATVRNKGNVVEAFDVLAYATSGDPTIPDLLIWNQSVTGLPPNTNLTLTFSWNTTDSTPGNYTLGFLATPVPGELYAGDNYLAAHLFLKIVGDINGDMKVDMRDVGTVARAFGTVPGDERWNIDADITGPEYLIPDSKVDMRDVGLVARRFGETYP